MLGGEQKGRWGEETEPEGGRGGSCEAEAWPAPEEEETLRRPVCS